MNKYLEQLNKMQNEASDSLIHNKIGTCQIHTGGGKWFISFKAILKLYKQGLLDKDTNILVLAENQLRELSLKEELNKFNEIYNIDLRDIFNFEFKCYQTVYKWTDRYHKVVLADEIHSSLTPAYYKYYLNNTYEYLFGLTATPDLHIKYDAFTRKQLFDIYCPIIYKYDLVEGSKQGTVRDVNIYIIQHQLDNKDKYIKAGSKVKSWFQTEYDAYNYAHKMVNKAYFSKAKTLKEKNVRVQIAISKRSRILYNLKSKESIIKYLIQAINKKILIFGNSIDELLKFSPVVSIRNSKEKNIELIDQFNKDKISCLGSFKMLQQGTTLSKLGCLIFHSYYSTKGKFEQMLGRLRFSKDVGTIFIIQTMNTKEVDWVNKMITNIKELDGFNINIINCANVQDAINKYEIQNQ